MFGMIARAQLSAMDYNDGVNVKQTRKKDGTLRYKQSYSEVTQN